jgi:hypothetical protein
VRRLEIEFLDAVAAQHDDPGLLRVCRVDEHLIGHCTVSLRRVGSLPPVTGGANKDGPDLSWKDWVTEPRHGAVQAGVKHARSEASGIPA